MKIIILGLILTFSNTIFSNDSFKERQKFCNLGNGSDCLNLGLMFENGQGSKAK